LISAASLDQKLETLTPLLHLVRLERLVQNLLVMDRSTL
jgi:hypothetical protein